MKLMEQRARVPLFMTYRAVGSSTGQKEFVGNDASQFMSLNHFGAGDIPMSQDRFNTMAGQSPPQDMVHIPLALGAIAVFHSVPGEETGGSLKLDACLLAKIFSGAVDTWDHADIKAQNPDINVPAGTKIHVFHRKFGSSSTGGVTGYLSKKCPQHWSLGASSSIDWPASSSFKPVEGSPGMQAALKDWCIFDSCATLKAKSNAAADAIIYPTAMQAFTFESSTDAYGGMATNVISLLGSALAVYAFISAQSVKAAPSVPHEQSGTIIGLASPMAQKENPPASEDLKAHTEKGREVRS
eukprot:Skav225027  [mRNA]  locus=scaffold2061:83993:92817:+ [translate_table: standard]